MPRVPATATKRSIEPVKALFEFTVEGRGAFPFDMLRYDQCWPTAEGRDVPNLTSDPRVGPGYRSVKRRISLTGLRAPSLGRWESFQWSVVARDR